MLAVHTLSVAFLPARSGPWLALWLFQTVQGPRKPPQQVDLGPRPPDLIIRTAAAAFESVQTSLVHTVLQLCTLAAGHLLWLTSTAPEP